MMDDFWDIDWSYLPDRAFQKIQRIVMSAKADTVPLGGKYYGQFRVNDICYNVIVGHLPSESFRLADDELVLGCMAFGPHDPSSLFADFSVVPDAAIDYIHEGRFFFDRNTVAGMTYASFQDEVEKALTERQNISRLHGAMFHGTNFWAKQDAAGVSHKLMPPIILDHVAKQEPAI